MKISARNVWKGTIGKVVRGAVNAEVIVQLPGGEEVVSIITLASLDALELVEGSEAYVVIKASSVMLATD